MEETTELSRRLAGVAWVVYLQPQPLCFPSGAASCRPQPLYCRDLPFPAELTAPALFPSQFMVHQWSVNVPIDHGSPRLTHRPRPTES